MHTIPSYETGSLELPTNGSENEATRNFAQAVHDFRQLLPDPDQRLGSIICTSLIPFARLGVMHVEADPLRIEDFTQDSMLSLYRVLTAPSRTTDETDFPLIHDPRGYAYRVGENTVRYFWVRQAKRIPTPHTDLVDTLYKTVAAADNVEHRVVEAEQFRGLLVALGEVSLTPRAESILRLNARGCTYREITEQLGIPAGSIGNTLRRAKQELVKQLIQNGYDVPWQFRHGVKDAA